MKFDKEVRRITYDVIYNEDCLVGMKSIPDDSIDMVLTSPPYDNLRTYNGSLNWNFDVFENVAQELFRIIKPGGVVVWIVGDATIKGSETGTSFRQALFFMDCGFNLHDTMIYQKTSPFPANVRYQQDFEYMFVFSKGKPNTFNPLQEQKSEKEVDKILKNPTPTIATTWRSKDGETEKPDEAALKRISESRKKLTKTRSNIWKINAGFMMSTKDTFAYEHPAIFPEKLAEDHILTWTNPEDIVLDPFLGSGTTAKMAVLTDRHYIGFETDPQYFDIACRRLDEAESQTTLFTEGGEKLVSIQ